MMADLGGIFLSEESQVRFHDVKEFRDHGGDAAKMSRTRSAAQLVAEAFDRDIGDRARRIHLFHTGREEKVHAFFFQQCAIAIEIARILCEVFVRSELKRIHEKSRPRRSHCARAARISDKCPSCSAPMVGTRPRRLPALPRARLARACRRWYGRFS